MLCPIAADANIAPAAPFRSCYHGFMVFSGTTIGAAQKGLELINAIAVAGAAARDAAASSSATWMADLSLCHDDRKNIGES
jgi:hypothetical protein